MCHASIFACLVHCLLSYFLTLLGAAGAGSGSVDAGGAVGVVGMISGYSFLSLNNLCGP